MRRGRGGERRSVGLQAYGQAIERESVRDCKRGRRCAQRVNVASVALLGSSSLSLISPASSGGKVQFTVRR